MEIITIPSKTAQIKNYIVFFIYLFINMLFVVKYGEEHYIPFFTGYIIMIFGLVFFYTKIRLKDIIYQSLFWIGIFLFFLFSLYLNYKIDGNSLNVDRWSAMEIGIKAVFNGKYPYNIPDHMGRESSNLPMLIVLGMPFYLIFGSVGYLQSFSFLFFSYLIFKIFDEYKQRLVALLLLVLSPSYLWEIYVKSDLFSNFIIILGFSYLVWSRFLKIDKVKSEWFGFLAALIFLTRLSSVIVLIILLFKSFLNFSIPQKMQFAGVFVLTILIIGCIFFHNAPDFNVFINHNPFMIQGAKQPLLLSFSYIVLAFAVSFKIQSFYEVVFRAGTLLFICVAVPFIIYFAELGYAEMITNSSFDISFFNMCMPFIMVALVWGMFKNKYKEN